MTSAASDILVVALVDSVNKNEICQIYNRQVIYSLVSGNKDAYVLIVEHSVVEFHHLHL